MTQQYTPVAWQDETTSQQGTLINAERLNQMQTAHHYADGFEEVDAVPTADPSVAYHKVVYCTADSTFYRWDGTEWTKDIDDETKALLQQEIARATQADSQLNQRVDDEHDARVDAEAAIHDRITDEATELAQRITTEASTRYTADTALGTRITNETSARETADTNLGNRITAEATARAEADTLLGGRIDTEQARAEAAEQANAQAIANTYTKAEADTLLAGKASTSTVQTLDTRVDTLESAVADTYNKSQTDTLLAGKADQATTYTKTETDTLLATKANTSTTYTKTEVQTYVSNALDSYEQMVRTTGNTTIYGVKEFINPIKGQLAELAHFGSNTTAGWYAICKLPKVARELYIMCYAPGNMNLIMAETNTHSINVIKWVGNYAPNQNRFMWVETASNMILYIYSATYRTNVLTLLNYSVYGAPVNLNELDKSVFTGLPETKPEVGGDIVAVYDESLLNLVTQ